MNFDCQSPVSFLHCTLKEHLLRRLVEMILSSWQMLIEKSHYTLRSSSTSNSYDVDLTTLTCSCADFPQVAFCKHLAAVKREFHALEGSASANSSSSQAELCPNNTPLEAFPASVDQGFEKPQGFYPRVRRVGVGVQILRPPKNPYPSEGYQGFWRGHFLDIYFFFTSFFLH